LLDEDISIAAPTPMEGGGAMRILEADAARFIVHHVMAALILSAIDEREEQGQ
jgi:hypothetical protein